LRNFRAQFDEHFVANFQAVQQTRGHEQIIAWGKPGHCSREGFETRTGNGKQIRRCARSDSVVFIVSEATPAEILRR
jgi:hypothetical protein